MQIDKNTRILISLLLIFSFLTIANDMFLSLFSAYVTERLHGSYWENGIAYSIFLIIDGIGVLVFGYLEDKFKNLELWIFIATTVKTIAYIGLFLCNSIVMLIVIQGVLGLAEAILIPAFYSLYSEISKKHKPIKWSLTEATYSISASIGGLVGGFIAQLFGLGVVFLYMAVLSSLSSILALYLYYLNKLKH
jgi:MFS family permease